jgi:hypothetical protein
MNPAHFYIDTHITTWLSQESLMCHYRGNDWNVSHLDNNGEINSDNLDNLVAEAFQTGQIRSPEAVTMWCQYVSPFIIQIFVCISEQWTGSQSITVVSPNISLMNIDNHTTGVLAADYALREICDIAHQLLSEVLGLGDVIVAQTTSDGEILTQLANTGSPATLHHLLKNPCASDEDHTLAFLRLSTRTTS